ncbi:MAG: hypothetical protein AB1483_14235 [Candidatus Zixiibacteriota bacterium]
MDHSDVLKTELGEQYNQYRWVGQIQAIVLTFYGAVVTLVLSAAALLRPAHINPPHYVWIGWGLICLGLFGSFVGYGLFRSRRMQVMTARYMSLLLLNLVNETKDNVKPGCSAFRFRNLRSTGGGFSLSDTINLAILIAFYVGEALLIGGLSLLLYVWEVDLLISVALVLSVVALLVTPLVLDRSMRKERSKMDRKCQELAVQDSPENWADPFDILGFPLQSPPATADAKPVNVDDKSEDSHRAVPLAEQEGTS